MRDKGVVMRRFFISTTVALAVLLAASACAARTDGSRVITGTLSEATSSVSDDAQPEPEPEAEPESEAEPEVEVEAGDGSAADEAGEDAAAGDVSDPEVAALLNLLAGARGPDGGAVRGEITLGPLVGEFPLLEFTGAVTTRFECDAEGDMAVILDIPAGFDEMFFSEGASIETRHVDGVTYVRMDPETLAALGYDGGAGHEGEVWFASQTDEGVSPMADGMLPAAEDMCGADPLSEFGEFGEFLDDEFLDMAIAAEIVEIVGRKEEVRGVPATRVGIRVSLGQMLAAAAAAEGGETSEIEESLVQLGEMLSEGMSEDEELLGQLAEFAEMFSDLEFNMAVWIDDDMLIRRITFDLASFLNLGMFLMSAEGDLGAATVGDELPESLPMSLDFYDYGADIAVEAPPPEAVVDDSVMSQPETPPDFMSEPPSDFPVQPPPPLGPPPPSEPPPGSPDPPPPEPPPGFPVSPLPSPTPPDFIPGQPPPPQPDDFPLPAAPPVSSPSDDFQVLPSLAFSSSQALPPAPGGSEG